METIAMTDLTIIGALTSLAVVVITEITKFATKKVGQDVPSQYIVLFLAIIVGAGYQGYTLYMPEEVRELIYAFVGGSVGFATTIYSFLIKPMKNMAGSKDSNLNT